MGKKNHDEKVMSEFNFSAFSKTKKNPLMDKIENATTGVTEVLTLPIKKIETGINSGFDKIEKFERNMQLKREEIVSRNNSNPNLTNEEKEVLNKYFLDGDEITVDKLKKRWERKYGIREYSAQPGVYMTENPKEYNRESQQYKDLPKLLEVVGKIQTRNWETYKDKHPDNRFFKKDGTLITEDLDYEAIMKKAQEERDYELCDDAKEAQFQKMFKNYDNYEKYGKNYNGVYAYADFATAAGSLVWGEIWQKDGQAQGAVTAYNYRVDEIRKKAKKELFSKYDRNTFSDKEMGIWVKEHGGHKDGKKYYLPDTADEKTRIEFDVLKDVLKENRMKESARKHPFETFVRTSVEGIPRAIMSTGINIENAANARQGLPVHAVQTDMDKRNEVADQVIKDEYTSKWFGSAEVPVLGNLGNLIYDIGDNAVENYIRIKSMGFLGKGSSAVSLGMMGNDAMARGTREAKEKGLSDEDALDYGFTLGAIEIITEKLSIDAMMKPGTNWWKKAWRSFITGSSEEELAETGGIFAELYYMGDDSDFSKDIGERIKNGDSKFKAVAGAVVERLGRAGFIGGFTNVGMEGFSKVPQTIKENSRTTSAGQEIIDSGSVDVVVSQGLELDTESKAYKMAEQVQAKVKNGVEPSAKEVGNLARAVFEERKITESPSENSDLKFKIKENVDTESKYVVNAMLKNAESISAENKFSVRSESEPITGRKSDYIFDIFKKQGGLAVSPVLGNVELTRSGAKSTILHGFGKNKLAATKAIKSVIEHGDIISEVKNYNNTDVDRYTIAARGEIDGKESLVGVVVKSYPNVKDSNSKFYLHEAIIIETDSPIMTAPQLSVDTVSDSVSNESISNPEIVVNSEMIPHPSPAVTQSSQENNPPTTDVVPPPLGKEGSVVPGIRKGTWASDTFRRMRPKYYEVVDNISKRLGIATVIDEHIEDADGFWDPNAKELHISLNAESPIEVVVKHEITHILEGNKAYKDLVSFMKNNFASEWNEKRDAILKKYESKGKEISSDSLDCETMAELVEDREALDAFIEKVATQKPGLMDTVRKFFKEVLERLGKFLPKKELTKWEQAEKKWKKALDEAVEGGVKEGDGGRKYRLSDNARTEVKKALNDKNYKGEVKLTDNSPAILLSQKGVKDLPMVINASHLRENIFTEEEARKKGLKVNPDINYHGLGDALFLNVIDGLDEVTEAYRGTKNADNPARRESYFLLISQYTDSEGNVINVPVYVNEKGQYNRVFVDVNKIATVYGKIGLREYIKTEVEKGNLVRIKKRNIRASESTSPINADYETNASNDSISNPTENVKENIETKIPEGAKPRLKDISGIVDEKTEAEALLEAEMRLAEVEKENRAIRDLNTGLRAEIQATKDWKINPARVEEVVSKVKDAYGSKVKTADIAARVQEVAERLHENVDSDNFERIYAQSYRELAKIGEEIAENSKGFKDTTLYEQYADLRKMIKDTSISLSEQDRADMGDYNAFRKRNFGRIRLSPNNGMSVDSFYEELASVYPEWFDKEITHPADRLLRIEEVLDELQPTVNNMAVSDSGNAIAAELLESLLKTSTSDQQAIVDHLKKGYVKYYQQKNERLRQEYSEKLQKHRSKIKDRHMRETLLRLVNKFSRMREDIRQYNLSELMKGEELEAFYFEDATESDITDLAQRMLTPSEIDNGVTLEEKKAEVREKIKQAQERLAEKKEEYIDEILNAINEFDGVGLSILEKGYITEDGVKVMGRLELNRLREAYEAEKRTLGADFVPNKRIEDKISRLDRKQINELDIADVCDLVEVMQAVLHAIQNENRMLSAEKNKKISETAEKVRAELKAGGEHTDGLKFIGNIYNSWALTPIRRARQMVGYKKNSEFVEMFKKLNEGSRKALQFKQNTSRTFEELVASEDMKKFAGPDAEVIEVATEAGNIKITPALRVALYLHNKNFDNLRHIFYGGIVIPDVELLKKGKFEKAYEKGQTVKLTRRDINKICKGMSRFEHEFADIAGKWLNEDCKQAINETSNILLGYDVARVNNYMPLATDPNYTKTELLVQDGTLEGMGMLKSRAGGINPIYLMDILRVIENQNEKVSKYYGVAVPVRDMQAVYNQQGFDDSTKATIQKTWGNAGKTYIENLLKDLQGGRKKKSVVGNLRGKYAAAVLNLNVGTVFGQASGYPVVANTLGWGPVLKALGKKTTEADKNLRAKYTPEFWMREKGYTTAELGEYTTSQQGFFDNLPKGLDWLTAVDCLTTGKIWKAAEVYVNDEIAALKKKGGELPDWAEVESDAYYKRIAEMHDKAMEETQPVYNTMQQPDLLRSDNELVKSVTMFMSQRLQNYGAVYDALGEYRAAKKSGDAKWIQEAGVNWGRAISAQIVSAMVYSAAKFAGLLLIGKTKKYEDEEEEKITTKSLIHGYTLEVLGTLSSASIGGSELMNLLMSSFGDDTWYGMSAPSFDMLNDVTSSVVRLMNKVRDNAMSDNFDYREYIKPFKTLATDLSKFTGVPAENILDIAGGIGKNSLEAARRFGGVDTTGFDWQLLRMGTPISQRSEYKKFLGKIVKDAYFMPDGDAKNEKYAKVDDITKEMVRMFGEERVEGWQKEIRKNIYKEKNPEIETPESKFEAEKNKFKGKPGVEPMSDEYIDGYGTSEITYDGKTYKLTDEQTKTYKAKVEDKKSDYFDKIIGDNININEVFNGTEKHTRKTSDSKERKVKDYFYYLADSGEITEEEAKAMYKQYLRGEIEVPVFDTYTMEYLTYDQMTRSQREDVIDDKKKERKKGVITRAEYDVWYNDFVGGKISYQKQKIIYGNYNDLDDTTKSKILTKIQNRAVKEAQAEMKDEIVGE